MQNNTPHNIIQPTSSSLTRRKFLRDTALTAASIGAFGILSSKAQTPAPGKTLKVAVIGCGVRSN